MHDYTGETHRKLEDVEEDLGAGYRLWIDSALMAGTICVRAPLLLLLSRYVRIAEARAQAAAALH